MADNLVKRAREVLEGVTPGPWKYNVDGAGDFFITRSDGQHIIEISGGDDQSEPDSRFVADSRDLVPAMADRLEALEAENAALRESLQQSRKKAMDEAIAHFEVDDLGSVDTARICKYAQRELRWLRNNPASDEAGND